MDESHRPPVSEPTAPAEPQAEESDSFAPPPPAPSFASFETAEAEDFASDAAADEAVDELGAESIDELEVESIDDLFEVEEDRPAAVAPEVAIKFDPRGRPSHAGSAPIEFLTRPSATTTAAAPKPASEPNVASPGARTPSAAAFTALAGEVARLGVPEGHRAAARAALLDMARGIDSESPTWDAICQVLTMAAAYPSLARRAIPLIVPFLDAE